MPGKVSLDAYPWCDNAGMAVMVEQLLEDLEAGRPHDVRAFMREWVDTNLVLPMQRAPSSGALDVRPTGYMPSSAAAAESPAGGRRRGAISGEIFQPGMVRSADIVRIRKTPAQRQRLHELLAQLRTRSFLFSQLSGEDVDLIFGALSEVSFRDGDRIITQGEEGDYFYILEKGTCHVYKVDPAAPAAAKKARPDSPPSRPHRQPGEQHVKTYGPGDGFGELALIYAASRAASVVSIGDTTLWTIDRVTYRSILMGNTMRRRTHYRRLIQELPLLRDLPQDERGDVIDALETVEFDAGVDIVAEGQPGDAFFFVIKGACDVLKAGEMVGCVQQGDYFGELALLRNERRAATVRTTCPTVCAKLAKRRFDLLRRAAEPILEERSNSYAR